MFGPAGIAYVYLVYGMYDCLNVVAGPDGSASAVLVRAVEPLEGLELMRADRARISASRRKTRPAPATTMDPVTVPVDRVASGPGLVGAAFGLDRSWTGTDLCDPASPLRLEPGDDVADAAVVATPRVGIAYAGDPWVGLPWRLALAGHRAVSGPRASR